MTDSTLIPKQVPGTPIPPQKAEFEEFLNELQSALNAMKHKGLVKGETKALRAQLAVLNGVAQKLSALISDFNRGQNTSL